MHIGIDFDNTIVCYDALFHRVCRERELIPDHVPPSKSEVRNYLRQMGREDDWTEIQGYIYGARMAEASAFPGVIEFFQACRRSNIQISIISHKTRQPYRGENYDLHRAARDWLKLQGFFDSSGMGLTHDQAFFELTKQDKLDRIAACGCTHFIDDLPEFLTEPGFPKQVQRLLFDPNNHYPEQTILTRFKTWSELQVFVHDEHARISGAVTLPLELREFVRQSGMAEDFSWELLPGGANNRVYRLRDTQHDRVLKWYFNNPMDPRDRFGNERGFYELLWRHGMRQTPEPLDWEPTRRLGLFKYVSDRKLKPAEVDGIRVSEALDFVRDLNGLRRHDHALRLCPASEACFKFTEHLGCVDRRVLRLTGLKPQDELDQEAARFVSRELQPLWQTMRASLLDRANQAGVDLETPLSEAQRCLSPSDFGFHNALVADDGRLRFFDFEYAGWDDPAKLICDFFCQPEIPVPASRRALTIARLQEELPLDARGVSRAWLLWPAYQIKWCCIMLNEFLRAGQTRRQFAGASSAQAGRRGQQLLKARAAWEDAVKMWHCHFTSNTPSW